MIDTFTGFAVVRIENRYRGVDREPFEPKILPGDIEDPGLVPEWRERAYRLFEKNEVSAKASGVSLHLIRDAKTAFRIHSLIEPHSGPHEVVRIQVYRDAVALKDERQFLGVDVAYFGGDFYSAVKNGLLHAKSHPGLERCRPWLNANELFGDIPTAVHYLQKFVQLIPSESDSVFAFYAIYAAESG